MSLNNIFLDLQTKYPTNKIELYDSMIWFQYLSDTDTLYFEIYDCTTIDVSSQQSGISYKKELLSIIKSIAEETPQNLIPGYAIERLISNLYDSAGFTNTELETYKLEKMDYLYTNLKKIIKDPNREITMVSFGEKFKSPKSMEQSKISDSILFKCDKTFDARHINSVRPKGGGLRDLRGTDEIVQKCIESGSGFEFVMGCIIKSIEQNNYKTIGVYCSAGHHRSIACVELLKKHLYPNAKVKHLHINR